MKNFLLIPDSYKGTLSSMEICEIMSEQIIKNIPDAHVTSVPVADGGEGSVDCFLSALSGQKIFVQVNGPYFEPLTAFYGVLPGGDVAVIEMAAASGLPLVEGRKNPMLTTTFGVGELMLDAARKGVKKIIIGLGGSCTNDFGCGAAAAVGIKFYNNLGESFIPTGESLKDINEIDFSTKDKLLDGVEIVAMCDVDNPPFGKNGAAQVFAPQKGASADCVELLDQGVRHVCELFETKYNINLKNLSGGGAAGAFGAGLVGFFSAQLKMGIDTVLDTIGFDDIISNVDMIFTGEGKIDGQSLRGKVVIGVAKRAKQKGVPVIAVVGGAAGDVDEAYNLGVSAIFSINRLPEDFSVSRYKSKENLAFTMDNLIKALKLTCK